MRSERTEIKTTCPRDCYDSCGISVMVEGGRIRSVKGDPDHFLSRGSLCGKCSIAYNGVWLDPAARLNAPLKRIGGKGTGHFAPVSWAEAIKEIAARLQSLLETHPASSVLHTHYTGTCSVIAGNFPLRFFRRLGATEVDPDTVCNKAGHEALGYTLGTSMIGFDPRTASAAASILVWGANPYSSAPHIHQSWLPEAPGIKIVIDPIAHPTAKAADLFLQLRPGTDAALAFALIHAVEEAGLLRRDFLDAHTFGWSAIEEGVRAMTPERGEALTGVPASLIREAAMVYGRGPSLMWLGQGMQRQKMGGNACRAALALVAATGNIGRAGAGVLYLNGPATRGVDLDYVTKPELARDGLPTLSHMDLAQTLADPGRAQALFCWNNNILASSPQQAALRRALEREDLLHVALDIFATDTTDYADYVLPAASFLEFDDLMLPYFHNAVSVQRKVVDPVGEALPNQEIFRRLAAAMGFKEPELYEPDDEILRVLLEETGLGLDFEGLAARGTAMPEVPLIPFADLVFPTPSGRIEIASERAREAGHPYAPLPHADQSAESGMLRVLSPASEWQLNSSYGNDGKIRGRLGVAPALVNPADAAMLALADGTEAVLENATGTLPVVVRLSADVPRGVALVHKGRWPKFEAARANVNVLNPGEKADMGESSCVHAVEARLSARARARQTAGDRECAI
ncbi:MAG TPA: molybdopterin-dependent oxidoreductase [Methylovirgula sp.]|nr:molybdopterin-dependent oxidoreductase [Methylovirgula sp.]